ncbi:MAG: nucleoside hydrolase, partial [Gammaproteobacteria bacterium]|nr:nucleoside hydrolase [Gammaproteobacteria bacterium]
CDIAGRRDIPVFAGCERPMVREAITAEFIHGNTGIDGVDVFEPKTPLEEHHAADLIIEALLAAEEAFITLVPTGPLSNIGTAIEKNPAILRHVKEIVIMGGAMREGGNRSPSAEFNILVDPQAADIVFNCGRPITVMGLDVTHQVLSTRERVAQIKALDNPVAEATAGMLSFFHRYDSKKYGSEGAPLHDPCTIAWLLNPSLFQTQLCNLSVETESELTMGHTAVDFWHVTNRPHNVNWTHAVDADGFYALLTDRLARFEQ